MKRREERRIIKVYAEGAVTEFEYLSHYERRSSEATLHWGEAGRRWQPSLRVGAWTNPSRS